MLTELDEGRGSVVLFAGAAVLDIFGRLLNYLRLLFLLWFLLFLCGFFLSMFLLLFVVCKVWKASVRVLVVSISWLPSMR